MKKNNKLVSLYNKLVIPIEIFERIYAFTQQAEGEISGFGKTDIKNSVGTLFNDSIVIEEFDIFTQECTAVHTTLKSEDMTQMYVGVAQSGGDPSKWNFWWHSHVDFNTNFSSEDDSTMKNITMAKNGQEGSVLVALCTNKFGEYSATVYENGECVTEALVLVVTPKLTPELLKDTNKLIKDKVSIDTPIKHFKDNYLNYIDNIKSEFIDNEIIINNDDNLSRKQRKKIKKYNRWIKKFKRQPGWRVLP